MFQSLIANKPEFSWNERRISLLHSRCGLPDKHRDDYLIEIKKTFELCKRNDEEIIDHYDIITMINNILKSPCIRKYETPVDWSYHAITKNTYANKLHKWGKDFVKLEPIHDDLLNKDLLQISVPNTWHIYTLFAEDIKESITIFFNHNWNVMFTTIETCVEYGRLKLVSKKLAIEIKKMIGI
jgi:hypothetical protein